MDFHSHSFNSLLKTTTTTTTSEAVLNLQGMDKDALSLSKRQEVTTKPWRTTLPPPLPALISSFTTIVCSALPQPPELLVAHAAFGLLPPQTSQSLSSRLQGFVQVCPACSTLKYKCIWAFSHFIFSPSHSIRPFL